MPTASIASRFGSSSAPSGVPMVMLSALVDFTASAPSWTPASSSRSRTGTPSQRGVAQRTLPPTGFETQVSVIRRSIIRRLEQVLVGELDLLVDHAVDAQRVAVDGDVGHAQRGVDAVEVLVGVRNGRDARDVEAGARTRAPAPGAGLRQRDVGALGGGGRAAEGLPHGTAGGRDGTDGGRGRRRKPRRSNAAGRSSPSTCAGSRSPHQQPGLAVLDGLDLRTRRRRADGVRAR